MGADGEGGGGRGRDSAGRSCRLGEAEGLRSVTSMRIIKIIIKIIKINIIISVFIINDIIGKYLDTVVVTCGLL